MIGTSSWFVALFGSDVSGIASFVLDISDVTAVWVYSVGNNLATTVRQDDVIRSAGGLSVTLLLAAVVVVVIFVIDIVSKTVWFGLLL